MSERSLRTDIQPYIRALWTLQDEGNDAVLRQVIRDLEWQAVIVDRLLQGRMQRKRTGRYTESEQIERFQLDFDTYQTVEHLRRVGTDERSKHLPDIFEQARGELGEKTDTVKKAYYRFKKRLAAADRKLASQDWGITSLNPLERVLAANRLFARSSSRVNKPTSVAKPGGKTR